MTFWAAGAAVGGAAIGAYATNRASSRAANAQIGASRDATAASLFADQRANQAQLPWLGAGAQGLNQLSGMLGVDAGPNFSEGNFNVARYLELNPDALEYMQTSGRTAYDHFNEDGRRRTGNFWFNNPNANRAGSANFGALNKPFTMADFQADPGYQFRMEQGARALTNSAAARGGLLSGAAAKALTRYNQDYATGEFSNAWNRDNTNKTNQFNRLASLAGVGQTAANQVGNQSMATGQAVSNNILGAGNARASGYVGGANAITNGISQGVNWYQGNQMLNRLTARQANTYGTGTNPYAGYDAAANGGWGIE